ncbi:lipid A export permease/ATP-binding protein MsbA [Motiliproteus sediminis]|uniref:lipid A export permease/ATP-binding protein MsbA n=1 Tax=Motiliproteus sediminis TaxID=1468178 RepID=UPI001AF01EB5|nr:lipid A export permease/ATP-binding protein MsbA [Motiliproteus sediminis]
MKTNRELLGRVAAYVKPHWAKFLVAVAAMAVVASTEPAVAAMMQPLIDGTFIDKDPNAIVMVPLMFVGLFFVRGVGRIVATLGVTAVATRVVMQLRVDLFNHIQHLPQSYMDATTTGRLLSRVTYDVEQLSSTASKVWLILVRDSLIIVGLLGYMFYINWKLSMLVLITAPVIAIIIKLVSKRMRKSSRLLQENMGSLTHRLEENLKGHRLVKLFLAEQYEESKFHGVVNNLRQNTLKLVVLGAANSPVVQFVIAIALASVIYFAATLEGDAAMSPGQFVSFFTAMGMLFAPMRSLTSVNEPLQRGMAAAETLFNLLDQPAEPSSGRELPAPFSGRVTIRDLEFSYGEEQPVLRGINVELQPGETLALVGSSGSGKSTLTQLIARFYQPTGGSILFDGEDIQQLSLPAVRGQIAYVDQEVFLFNDSVAANVAYGDPNGIDEQRVRDALRHAHAEDFVNAMEGGIYADVGEQGGMLSGGQRQRLALARAFYKDAPLLILDEATSALDNESERQVQAALQEICEGRTTIIIAHRLSTIEHADRILVMDQGEVKETGSHQELLALDGIYRQLYREMH